MLERAKRIKRGRSPASAMGGRLFRKNERKGFPLRRGKLTVALTVGLLPAIVAFPAKGEDETEIHKLVEATKLRRYSDITFFLRMPRAEEPDANEDEATGWRSVHKADYDVRGILAVCTWGTNPEDVRKNIADKGRFKHFVKFADKHRLALVTWTNFKGYKIDVSGDEMEEELYERYNDDFDDRAREWRTGFRRLCRQYDLPERNVLMYGLSGGGQMAHRLALRLPEYFFAVHIHVNSSYDQIKDDGNQVLWLVTTGTREYGYPAGTRFYRDALEAGYHMIFRAEENLGHRDSKETRETSMAFFRYCLRFLPDPSDPDWKKPPVDRFYLMRYPTYIGDYLNGEAFPRKQAEKYVAPEAMVALPNKEIAEAWGIVLNFDH